MSNPAGDGAPCAQDFPERESVHPPADALLREYYTRYYRDELGLPDWRERVQARTEEEESVRKILSDLQEWFPLRLDGSVKTLAVGGGTGAEFIPLARLTDAYGVDPSEEAVHITRLKAKACGIDPERFSQASGEHLPFPDDYFGFICCRSVLEHVADVAKTVFEMLRVIQPGGWVLITCPDYRQFWEPHYKIPLPMFLPKWIIALILRLLRRPVRFLRSLKFVNSREITNILMEHPVIMLRIIHSWPRAWKERPTRQQRIVRWITRRFEIHRDQYWLVRKLEEPR